MHVLNHKHLILNHIIKQVVVMLILLSILLVFQSNIKKWFTDMYFLLLALLKDSQKFSSFSLFLLHFKGFYGIQKNYILKN